MKKQCSACREDFEIPDEIGRFISYCQPCREKQKVKIESERKAEIAWKRENYWKQICPESYLHTDIEQLPVPGILTHVVKWRYGSRGLLLHGPTGVGKSRCAWLLCKREWEAGRSLAVLNATSGVEYMAAFEHGVSAAIAWLRQFYRADIVLMDDVFKNRFTDSFEQALFGIISKRTDAMKPCIVTLNDIADSLKSRLSEDRGEPLIRRLVESCEIIKCIKPK